MKTIEKACIEFCEKLNSVYDEKEVFEAGSEFAQQWIYDSNDMPEDNNLLDKKVLVLLSTGDWCISRRIKPFINKDIIRWRGSKTFTDQIIAWRPIEYK